MIFRSALFVFILLWFSACSGRPDIDELSRENHEVVVLGGSAYGVTVASAFKAYDETIDVVLVEPEPLFVTEPYLNLLLAGKIDEKLVYRSFDGMAKRRGFTWINKPVVYVDDTEKMVVVDNRVIHYKRLVDARFHYAEDHPNGVTLSHEQRIINGLKERLNARTDQTILIDASTLPTDDRIRAEELYNILRSQGERHVVLQVNEKTPSGEYDLIIRYPQYDERAGLRFSDNFFVQFNKALETVGMVVREDLAGSYLPNMVKEERFIYQNAETLQGIDPETNTNKEGTEYLSKVIKIQRDFM